ncbi:hypothetical protein PLESTB_000636500 [Pleodorina starrii]|uniref:Uncharacterized protein n=1 Tax=Pleodorina starrii TaxID=330485 RepID=A0A9W6F186_9CHLO|nr:hypothetical protein PLESTB_000636500 [Pleodorina starrii]GLC71502.1 hypothetical protein PLESTF_001128900 [Pleodorina starrii]
MNVGRTFQRMAEGPVVVESGRAVSPLPPDFNCTLSSPPTAGAALEGLFGSTADAQSYVCQACHAIQPPYCLPYTSPPAAPISPRLLDASNTPELRCAAPPSPPPPRRPPPAPPRPPSPPSSPANECVASHAGAGAMAVGLFGSTVEAASYYDQVQQPYYTLCTTMRASDCICPAVGPGGPAGGPAGGPGGTAGGPGGQLARKGGGWPG